MAAQLRNTICKTHRGRTLGLVALFVAGVALGLMPAAVASTSMSFAPAADAHVYSNYPSDNFGAEGFLRSDAVPPRRAYLRFDVAALTGPVARATLRLYALEAHRSGFALHRAPSGWLENTITWQNAPAYGDALGSSGAFSAGQWLSFDVTSYVQSNGSYGFAFVSQSSSSLQVASREAGANAPQLVVEMSEGTSSSSSSTGSTTSAPPPPPPPSTTTETHPPSTTTETMPTGGMPPSPPPSCTGYAQPRVFLESQGWWMRTPGKNGTDFGHLHSGTCFPWGQTLSGVVHFEQRVVMHMNPGTLIRARVYMFHSGAPEPMKQFTPNYRCQAETCTWSFPYDLDTRLSYDGCQEFRFQAWVREPDGKELLATTGWRANIRNGRPVRSYCDARGINFTEGRGWYTGFGYENGRVDDVLPLAPVSGVWSPKLKVAPGSGGIAATYHMITIDPNFHMGNRGMVVREGPGAWGPGRPAIDTRMLANGTHRLVLRTDAATPSGSTLSGLLVFPFTVAN